MRRNWLLYFLLVFGIGVTLIAAALTWPALRILFDGNRAGRTFSIPSESMRPTLEIGDRVTPRAVSASDLHRGSLVVFRVRGDMWVFRVAGLPGDTIQMHAGRVMLNGVPVAQRPDGEGPPDLDGKPTRRFREQFPGEPTPHRILDSGYSRGDETELVAVPQGSVFLLGDNRDDAADSRFGAGSGSFGHGAGVVRLTDIFGEVDSISWSHGRWRVGRAIDDLSADGWRAPWQ